MIGMPDEHLMTSCLCPCDPTELYLTFVTPKLCHIAWVRSKRTFLPPYLATRDDATVVLYNVCNLADVVPLSK